jgi:predicted dehydrogenase
MSCSALRYDPEVQKALALRQSHGRIVSADVWTTATLHPGNPGLLHYGIHGVEILYALLGPGCRSVRCVSTPGADLVTACWNDGRLGSLRGIRQGEGGFGFAAHYEKGHYAAVIKGTAFYTEMLKAVVAMFASLREPIPHREMREIIALIAAARRSAAANGPARTL